MGKMPLSSQMLQNLMASKRTRNVTIVRPCELGWNSLTPEALGYVKDVVQTSAEKHGCSPDKFCVVAHIQEGSPLPLVQVFRKDRYGNKKKKSWFRRLLKL